MTRNELLGEAVDRCMEELYQYARPKVTWKDFIQQNRSNSIDNIDVCFCCLL
jgi:uncharacterized protein with HEPN domain